VSTLICQVNSRLPIGLVALYGTLDRSSAPRMMVTLRDCLAEEPTVLLLDVEHLVVAAPSAFAPLLGLVEETQAWPGARFGLCGPSPAIAEMLVDAAPVSDLLDVYANVAEGTDLARRVPVPPRRSLGLRPDANAPASSRKFAQETCAEWGVEKVGTLAELVASELVTNAVVHARTHVDVTMRLADDTLSLAVRDGDPRPMFRPAEAGIEEVTSEHGRGLLLLDAMADAWGCHPTGDGKVVWASIGVSGSHRDR
jgi:anti-sigma regulatory factor (Ser/Thr protein kinase)